MIVKLSKKEFVNLWSLIPCVTEKFDSDELQVISEIEPEALKSVLRKISQEVIRKPFGSSQGKDIDIEFDFSWDEIFAITCLVSNYEDDELVREVKLNSQWREMHDKLNSYL